MMVCENTATRSCKDRLCSDDDGGVQVLLRVLSSRGTSVHEEALLAVGAMTYACGHAFVKYLEAFFPVLLAGLTNHQVGTWATLLLVTLGANEWVCLYVSYTEMRRVLPYRCALPLC